MIFWCTHIDCHFVQMFSWNNTQFLTKLVYSGNAVLSELFSVFGERQRELLCVKYGVPHVSNIIRSCDVVGSHALLCFLLFSFFGVCVFVVLLFAFSRLCLLCCIVCWFFKANKDWCLSLSTVSCLIIFMMLTFCW